MFHLRQQERRINDPNGPCYWNGRYHLFFQHRDENVWAWGHAVSTDLLNWERLPDALLPAFRSKPGQSGYSGAESCWSGGLCIDGKQAVAVFYGHGGPDCGLYVMTSSDPMLCHWENVTEGPVIRSIDQPNEGDDLSNPSPYNSVPYCQAPMLYDPYIWYEDGVYHLLSGGVARDKYTGGFRRQEYLYTSADLVNWTACHPLIADNSFQDVEDDGACPYFLPWKDGKTEGDVHRLLLHYSHQHGPRYVMGVYDKTTKIFTPYGGSRVSVNTKQDSYEAPALFANTPDGAMLATYIMHGRNHMPSVMSMVHKLERCGERLEEIAVSPAADIDAFPFTRKTVPGEESCIKTAGETTIFRMKIHYDKTVAHPILRFHRENGEIFGSMRLHANAGGRRKRGNQNYYSDVVSLVMEDSFNTTAPMTIQMPPTNDTWELTLVLDADTLEAFFPNALSIGRRIYGDLKGMYLSLEGGRFVE